MCLRILTPRFLHTNLFCGVVSEGAAVVREAPAEAAARLRRQQEAVFLQDHNLFFQTHHLTYRASWHLYKVLKCYCKWAPSARSCATKLEVVPFDTVTEKKRKCTHKKLLLVKNSRYDLILSCLLFS